MTYRVSNEAELDLIQIYFEGADQFGELQAIAYQDALKSLFEKLADFPNLGRLRLEIDPPAHGIPFRSHIVFYDIEESGDIFIVRIRHGREDWMNDPDDLPV